MLRLFFQFYGFGHGIIFASNHTAISAISHDLTSPEMCIIVSLSNNWVQMLWPHSPHDFTQVDFDAPSIRPIPHNIVSFSLPPKMPNALEMSDLMVNCRCGPIGILDVLTTCRDAPADSIFYSPQATESLLQLDVSHRPYNYKAFLDVTYHYLNCGVVSSNSVWRVVTIVTVLARVVSWDWENKRCDVR